MKKLIYICILCFAISLFSITSFADEGGFSMDLMIGGSISLSPNYTGLSEDLIKLDAGNRQTYLDELYGGDVAVGESGATMGLGFDLDIRLKIYGWFFFKTGMSYTSLLSGGHATVELGYNTVDDFGLAVTMDNAQYELLGKSHCFKVPMVLGIYVPVSDTGGIYAGLGPVAYMGWISIEGSMNANYINLASGAVVASDDVSDSGTVTDRDYDIKWHSNGIGIQYMVGFEQQIFVDNLFINFIAVMDTYSSLEDNEYASTPEEVNPLGGSKAIDSMVLDGFDDLTGGKVSRYMAPDGTSRAQFPVSFSGFSFFLGVTYRLSLL